MTEGSSLSSTAPSLDAFDFLELLAMLSQGGRTGVLRVVREARGSRGAASERAAVFQCWLEEGRIRHLTFGYLSGLTFGDLSGPAALTELLGDARGQFEFEEGARHPAPALDVGLDGVALGALAGLPLTLTLRGPARLSFPARVARLGWSAAEEALLGQVEAGVPLAELVHDPEAGNLLARLERLGLLVPRRPRVARLTVTLCSWAGPRAVVDGIILDRWAAELGQDVSHVALRLRPDRRLRMGQRRGGPPAGPTLHVLPVVAGDGTGASLGLSPELLVWTRLSAGELVLALPAPPSSP